MTDNGHDYFKPFVTFSFNYFFLLKYRRNTLESILSPAELFILYDTDFAWLNILSTSMAYYTGIHKKLIRYAVLCLSERV